MNPLDPSYMLQKRCMNCGRKLFPYNAQDAEDWAVFAYYESQRRKVSPSVLMYERAPNIDKITQKHPPKVMYY